MGIRGLSYFLDSSYPSLGQYRHYGPDSEERLQGLVVDGNALIHHLFGEASRRLRTSTGSVSPRECVEALHSFLAQVSGTPTHSWPIVFVFDGPIADAKMETRMGRMSANIRKIEKLLEAWTGSYHSTNRNWRQQRDSSEGHLSQYPFPLVISACLQALFEFGHEVYIAEQEADLDIAVLARERNSLILSNDSDFYILPSPGYMPLKSIPYGEEGPLSGRVYSSERVCESLGIAEHHLPLLAPLAGCDSFRRITNLAGNYIHENGHLAKCVDWLKEQGGTLDQALNALSLDDEALLTSIRDAATPYFAPSEASPASPLILPKYTPGRSHPQLQELIQNATFWCGAFVEDDRCVSSWEASSAIREQIYASLGLSQVKEYMRVGQTLACIPVTPAPDGSILKLWDRVFSRESLPAGMSAEDLPWILSCQRFLTYSQAKDSLVPSCVLVALICSGMLCKTWWKADRASPLSKDTHGPNFDTALTRADIDIGAQLESILFCLFLLGQVHTATPDSQPNMPWNGFWSRLDLRILYKCLELSRGGKSPEQILERLRPREILPDENVEISSMGSTYYTWMDLILDGIDVTKTIDPVIELKDNHWKPSRVKGLAKQETRINSVSQYSSAQGSHSSVNRVVQSTPGETSKAPIVLSEDGLQALRAVLRR